MWELYSLEGNRVGQHGKCQMVRWIDRILQSDNYFTDGEMT